MAEPIYQIQINNHGAGVELEKDVFATIGAVLKVTTDKKLATDDVLFFERATLEKQAKSGAIKVLGYELGANSTEFDAVVAKAPALKAGSKVGDRIRVSTSLDKARALKILYVPLENLYANVLAGYITIEGFEISLNPEGEMKPEQPAAEAKTSKDIENLTATVAAQAAQIEELMALLKPAAKK